MKKIFFNSLYLLLMSIVSIAQNQAFEASTDSLKIAKIFEDKWASWGRVSYALILGANVANVGGRDRDFIFAENSSRWLPGIQVGMEVNTRFSEKFSLKHALLLSQRGAGITLEDDLNDRYNTRMRTFYVDVFPASPTYHTKNIQLFGGPYMSALAAASLRRKDPQGRFFRDRGLFGTPDNFEEETKYLQKFDFGLQVGIGFEITPRMVLQAQYLHGFTDIFQFANSFTNQSPKTDNIRIFNRALMISIAMRMGQ
ncbi:MAG: outer membrane beta-barrel protein [Runella sp.]